MTARSRFRRSMETVANGGEHGTTRFLSGLGSGGRRLSPLAPLRDSSLVPDAKKNVSGRDFVYAYGELQARRALIRQNVWFRLLLGVPALGDVVNPAPPSRVRSSADAPVSPPTSSAT